MILAHGVAPPAPELPGLLGRWVLEPGAALGIAVVAALYLVGVRRINRRHPDNPQPRARTAAFLTGLATIAMALMSPLGAYDTTLFSWHMAQHVLLVMVAPPLLLLGGPVTVALRASSQSWRRHVLQPILESRALHLLTRPVFTWTAFAAVMWATHFSGLFDRALESGRIHELEHALFLGSALLFWWPVLGIDPGPRRLSYPARALYLFLAMPQNTFLSLAIFSAATVRYPHYATLARSWGPDPLSDQHTAGGIMWVAGDLLFLAGLIVMMVMWARHEDRMAAIIDAQLDAERAALGDQPTRTSLSTAIETKSSPR